MLTVMTTEVPKLPDVPQNLGWFLTLLFILSGSGPVVSLILHFQSEKRKKNAEAKKTENEVKFDEVEATQRIIQTGDQYWVERERRSLEREQNLERELREVRREVDSLRQYMGDLMAFVIEDRGWHFDDERERRASGQPVKPQLDFEIFMAQRRHQREAFLKNRNGGA